MPQAPSLKSVRAYGVDEIMKIIHTRLYVDSEDCEQTRKEREKERDHKSSLTEVVRSLR
jgi:hypothetical protein